MNGRATTSGASNEIGCSWIDSLPRLLEMLLLQLMCRHRRSRQSGRQDRVVPGGGDGCRSSTTGGSVDVKTVAPDITLKALRQVGAVTGNKGQTPGPKRHARRHFKRGVTVVVQRFDAMDQKSSVGGQDVNSKLSLLDGFV